MNKMNKFIFLRMAYYAGDTNLIDGLGIPYKFDYLEGDIPPAGLQRKHFFKAWSIVASYGKFVTEFLFFNQKMVIFGSTDSIMGTLLDGRLIITTKSKDETDGNMLTFKLRNGLEVCWKDTISFTMVDKWFQKIEDWAREKGFWDEKGMKIINNEDLAFTDDKINTRNAFAKHPTIGPYPLSMEDTEIIMRYDHPEKVFVINTSIAKFTCLQGVQDFHTPLITNKVEKFLEMGVTTVEDLMIAMAGGALSTAD